VRTSRVVGALSVAGPVLAIAVAGAPTANAVCLESAWVKGTTGTCPEEFTGTPAQFLALPEVREVTEELTAIARGPFLWRTSTEIVGGDGELQVRTIFFRDGVTRRSERATSLGAGSVTYLDAQRSCTRAVTTTYPNTIAADAKATWKCRARKASDRDGSTSLLDWLPEHNLAVTSDGQWAPGTWVVPTTGKAEYDATQLSLGFIVGNPGCRVHYAYRPTTPGLTLASSSPACSTPESDSSWGEVTGTGIGKLAKMANFKTQ